MNNEYLPKFAKVLSNQAGSIDTKLLTLQFVKSKEQKLFQPKYLQFVMLGLPTWGEGAFSLASSPADKNSLTVAIRKVGLLTNRLHWLKKGDYVTIRGPFGKGLTQKLANQSLLLIGGGCGFIPLRPIILDHASGLLKLKKLTIFYGCKNQDTLLFKTEHKIWSTKSNLQIILEQPANAWTGQRGLLTDLFNQQAMAPETKVIMVGPPTMYRFVIKKLQEQKIPDQNIFISLERKMYCGQGICQHCATGPYYVCQDGPVFTWKNLKIIPESI